MSRSARVLEAPDLLRRHRRAVSGQSLVDALGLSLRRIYRDIHTKFR